jgi:hypothetical protein
MLHCRFSIGLWNCSDSVALLVFHFSIGLWNWSESVALLGFLLGFGTLPTVWHYLFYYWTLELFRQCGIICLSIELWKCSDSVAFFFSMWLWNWSESVALFGFLMDFGTVPTVWHYQFFIFLLDFGTDQRVWQSEQFESPIEKTVMPHCRNSSKVQ